MRDLQKGRDKDLKGGQPGEIGICVALLIVDALFKDHLAFGMEEEEELLRTNLWEEAKEGWRRWRGVKREQEAKVEEKKRAVEGQEERWS